MSVINWVSCVPEDDVESFTERSEERRQVFKEAATRLPTTELSPLVWAFLQVGDLERVKEIAQNKASWISVKDNSGDEAALEYKAKDAVLLWKQRPEAKLMTTMGSTPTPGKRSFSGAFSGRSTLSNQSPTSPLRSQVASPASETRTRSGKPLGGPTYSPQRDRRIAERCKERDQGLCVVSKLGAVDACHVYPWCAFGGKDQKRVARFWGILRMFWPDDKVDSWYGKLFRDDRDDERKATETVENMLTFTSTLHRFHSEGAFALRPIRMSDDKTQLELEFHWLARAERDSSVKMDLLEEPLSSRDRDGAGGGFQFCRFDKAGATLLVSGTKFTMTTDDATNKPLPDPGLLELQWHLQRILAMSGAAGWKEEDFDHDDPGTAVVDTATVSQWLDDQEVDDHQTGQWEDDHSSEDRRSRSSSTSSSVEIVNGASE